MSQTIPQSLPLIVPILQIILALGLFNVWLLRFKKSTAYRGGSAKTLPDEFAVYGLPKWFMYIVGALKMIIAVILIVSAFMPSLSGVAVYALGLLAILMVGAISMHIKVRDIIIKMIPAMGMFVMTLAVLYLRLF